MYDVSRHGRVRPLFRNCLVDTFICSVDDGNAVGVDADSGEEDLRRQKKVWSGDLCCDGRFRRWSISGGVDNGMAGAGQTTQSFL